MKKFILPPTLSRFPKQHKGVLTSTAWKHTAHSVHFGLFGIKVLKSLRLNLKQLELTRRQIVKHLTKFETFCFRVVPDIPVSKKPNEIRMGKGKGPFQFWAFRVQAGQTFVEFNTASEKKAILLFDLLSKKLPVPCSFVTNSHRIS